MLVYPILSFFYNVSLVEWTHFKQLHGKRYKSPAAEESAMRTFRDNLRKINKHNSQLYGRNLSSYRMAINRWSDKSHDDFREYYGLYGNQFDFANDRYVNYVSREKLPPNVDWNEAGFVTPPQDQGNCGSCWAFAAVGAIEAQIFKSSGNLTALSVQNLLDCSETNIGCDGGSPLLVSDFVPASRFAWDMGDGGLNHYCSIVSC